LILLTWLYAYDIYFLYRKKRLKKIIIPLSITVLFFSHLIGLSKEQNSIKQIPEFSGKNAYEYLVKQCDFGPRNPGLRLPAQTGQMHKYYSQISAGKIQPYPPLCSLGYPAMGGQRPGPSKPGYTYPRCQ